MVHVYMGNNTCIIINILYDNLCQRFRNVLTLPKKKPKLFFILIILHYPPYQEFYYQLTKKNSGHLLYRETI